MKKLLENNFGGQVGVRWSRVLADGPHRVLQDQLSIAIEGRALVDLADVQVSPLRRGSRADAGGAGRGVVRAVVADLPNDAAANVDQKLGRPARLDLVVVVGQRQTRQVVQGSTLIWRWKAKKSLFEPFFDRQRKVPHYHFFENHQGISSG